MIKVTLSFINIDAAIKGLREIPQNLLVGELPGEVESKAVSVTVAEVIAERNTNGGTLAESKATAEKKSSAKPAAASTQPTAEKSAAPEPKVENSDVKPASIEYPVLQKAVFALAAKSREAATTLCATFGVKTFKELDPSKWGEALAAVNAKLAEAA